MKKKRLSSLTSTQGFTLIELLIVIVIIGILLGTLLPRLTTARTQATDLASQVLANQFVQALEAYYTDNGVYPGTTGTGQCGSAVTALEDYLKDFPLEPKTDISIDAANCTGDLFYVPLVYNGIDANGYMVAVDVELPAKANHLISDLPTIDGTTTPEDITSVQPDGTAIAQGDALDPTDSIYYLTNN